MELNGTYNIGIRNSTTGQVDSLDSYIEHLLPHLDAAFINQMREAEGDVDKAWNQFCRGAGHIDVVYDFEETLESLGLEYAVDAWNAASHIVDYDLMKPIMRTPALLDRFYELEEVLDLLELFYENNHGLTCECDGCCC